MRFIGDFHIHSSFSRATSRDLTPENLDLWGRLKGIGVIGTGDFTHPGWVSLLEERIEPAEEGLFTLKAMYRRRASDIGFASFDGAQPVRFMLTAEISTIYSFGGRVRKIHHVVFAPDFASVRRIQERIERLGGNIRSDGRPILGLDSRDLLELCLDADSRIFFVPAHIWTPWFSALGSKSGFDSIRECYRDLAPHIRAVETGLSSDPPMNWLCTFLDDYTLISNSDAHSPDKLGREANIFDTELSYPKIVNALSAPGHGFLGTIEFYPQEGKYHFDGHRKCGIVWDPLETLRNRGLCPRCGKPVTVGVLNRAAQLADRDAAEERPHRDPFHSLIPLKEILAEIEGAGTGSKKVCRRYAECLDRLGPELSILLSRDCREIERAVGGPVASAVERTRERRVLTEPGYDGEYGRIRTWRGGESGTVRGNRTEGRLFQDGEKAAASADDEGEERSLPLVDFDVAAFRELRRSMGPWSSGAPSRKEEKGGPDILEGGTPEQESAAGFMGDHSLILAGPGTGKTRTLVSKIVKLLEAGVRPERIMAVTFTNKAAREIGLRVAAAGEREGFPASGGVRIRTFHGFGLSVLEPRLALVGRSDRFMIVDDQDKQLLLKDAGVDREDRRRAIITLAGRVKNMIVPMPTEGSAEFDLFRMYQELLMKEDLLDFDDLVFLPVTLFRSSDEIREEVRGAIDWLLIDEFQDINPAQYRLVTLLSGGGDQEPLKLCAIGDPNQSIYRFRGASPAFIDRFRADFPDVRVFTLSFSYRCPRIILDASAQVIGRGDEALAGLRQGVRISVMKAPTEAAEAEQIARDIERRTGGVSFFSFDSGVASYAGGTEPPEGQPCDDQSVSLSGVAVLCRTGLLIPRLRKALRDHRIPFVTIGTESVFDEEPFRSFLLFCRALFRSGRGTELPLTLHDALVLYAKDENAGSGGVGTEKGERRTGRNELMREKELTAELSRYWQEGETLRDFLSNARLASGVDRYDRGGVRIMTIHASKGLEFDVVYVPGCEDSILPCTLSEADDVDLEEEKRLLYVAMTRASKDLVLSWAERRTVYGKTMKRKRSPFLSAIEDALLRHQEAALKTRTSARYDQLSLFD